MSNLTKAEKHLLNGMSDIIRYNNTFKLQRYSNRVNYNVIRSNVGSTGAIIWNKEKLVFECDNYSYDSMVRKLNELALYILDNKPSLDTTNLKKALETENA